MHIPIDVSGTVEYPALLDPCPLCNEAYVDLRHMIAECIGTETLREAGVAGALPADGWQRFSQHTGLDLDSAPRGADCYGGAQGRGLFGQQAEGRQREK